MHRTQDTYPLSHLRQHMNDHLARVKNGAVETITQNGEGVKDARQAIRELANKLGLEL